jgi:hypothetical protein
MQMNKFFEQPWRSVRHTMTIRARGSAACRLVHRLLLDRDTCKAFWHRAKVILQEKLGSAIRIVLLLAVAAFGYGDRQVPAEPFVHSVLVMVETLGFVPTMLIATLRAVTQSADGWGVWSIFWSILQRVIWSLAVYAMALWMIGTVGDDAYRGIIANPDQATVIAISLAICWAILRIGSGSVDRPRMARSELAGAAGTALLPRKSTSRDTRYTAAHEAGHALVYAALGGLPSDIRLVVNEQADENGVLGFITGIYSGHRLDERTFVEWHMLVLLAGMFGEIRVYGKSTLGSSSDHLRWLDMARVYLANYHRGIYYIEPKNTFEQQQNEAKLDALRAEQLALLRTFFDLNAEVFAQLADTLLERRTLGREDLIPFLSRAELPHGFPLPFGPFQQFSAEWPAETREGNQAVNRGF